ncbi:hypothetical protein HZH66_008246 [Vespula vulgaris]|uniref:Uncharacterized protein n=1 Tax=Vespula vulgaris TaxID=7454 RepID=A0A834N3M3_VESVU|nr:hypothetical protein HZH66_008246 [Vespula vulgaris]
MRSLQDMLKHQSSLRNHVYGNTSLRDVNDIPCGLNIVNHGCSGHRIMIYVRELEKIYTPTTNNGRRSPSSSIRVNEGLRVEGEACHKVERGLGRYALESNEAKLSSPSCIPQAIAPRGNGLKRVEWQMHKTTNHGDVLL